MTKHYINAKVGGDSYPIVVGYGAVEELEGFLESAAKPVALVVDSCFKDNQFSGSILQGILRAYPTTFVEGGIDSKGINSAMDIIDWLFSLKFPRDGIIVAIGGGVIGDLGAFVASVFMRGVSLVHVPTTTTSMIDSSIGGKTGINHQGQVNLVGTYYNPAATFMDLRFVETLERRDYAAGLCESLKMALTSDSQMSARLLDSADLILKREKSSVLEVVRWSVMTKLAHVAEDVREKSLRLLLNYGHTFGQSIESFYGLSHEALRHGEAVALGMVAAARLADLLDLKSPDGQKALEAYTISLLDAFGLPSSLHDLSVDGLPHLSTLLEGLVNDKKRISSGNRFVLLDRIGVARVRQIDDFDLIRSAYAALL